MLLVYFSWYWKGSDVRRKGCEAKHTCGMILSYFKVGGGWCGGRGAQALFALTKPIEYIRHPLFSCRRGGFCVFYVIGVVESWLKKIR